jgi:hypothetical protein
VAEPWFDPNTFGAWFGTIGGGVGGPLGGLWGGLAGRLAPQGKGRAWVLGIGWGFFGAGVLLLAAGVYALVAGQPYGIWYGPCLIGGLFTLLFGILTPVVRHRYDEAEQRRLQAEDFRQG